jgi:hypothetical protein
VATVAIEFSLAAVATSLQAARTTIASRVRLGATTSAGTAATICYWAAPASTLGTGAAGAIRAGPSNSLAAANGKALKACSDEGPLLSGPSSFSCTAAPCLLECSVQASSSFSSGDGPDAERAENVSCCRFAQPPLFRP